MVKQPGGTSRRRGFRTGPLAVVLTVLFAVASVSSGCGQGDEPRSIDLSQRENVPVRSPASSNDSLRIAVGAMIVPSQGFLYYKDLLDFVGERVGKPVRMVDRESYAEINDLLKEGNIEAAFVCSGPYVEGHDSFGLELLAVPVVNGEPVYRSFIIVHRDSPVEGVEGLRGKTFAFTDPHSNSGKLVPTHLLATMGETPSSFFKSTTFTYAHDKSIIAVAEKLVDGAAVDSLIWEYIDRTDPRYTSRTKVIWESAACGIPPFVVRGDLDPGLKAGLRNAFLTAHEIERGREILEKLMIERFVPGDDSLYDSIREMKRFDAEFSREAVD